jgi:hypothetical protein
MEVVAPGSRSAKKRPLQNLPSPRRCLYRQTARSPAFFQGVFDHFEQRLRLLFAVNDPVGVENLVAAVLRVRLREHIQFDIVRVAAQLKRILQVVNFVFCQRQPQTEVGVNQRLTALPQQVNAGDRRRLMVSEQLLASSSASKTLSIMRSCSSAATAAHCASVRVRLQRNTPRRAPDAQPATGRSCGRCR